MHLTLLHYAHRAKSSLVTHAVLSVRQLQKLTIYRTLVF